MGASLREAIATGTTNRHESRSWATRRDRDSEWYYVQRLLRTLNGVVGVAGGARLPRALRGLAAQLGALVPRLADDYFIGWAQLTETRGAREFP